MGKMYIFPCRGFFAGNKNRYNSRTENKEKARKVRRMKFIGEDAYDRIINV